MREFEPMKDKGICEHGNFPKTCSKCSTTAILGVQREDLTGAAQRERGKRNVRYEKDGKRMIAKYIDKQPEDSDNIARLVREKKILNVLSDTGLVPKVIDYKEYENDRARLLLEEIPGTSIDHMPRKERGEFLKQRSEDVVHETARSLQKIRERGVYIVDVNEGTFLFHEAENGHLETRLVDFELGYDVSDGDPEELKDSFSFVKKNDFGFALAEQEGRPLTEDVALLAKCEMHRWARMMERIFINRYAKVEIPPEQATEFAEYQGRIQSVVEQTLGDRAKRHYATMQKTQRETDRKYIDMGEEGYVAWSIKLGMESAITQQCVKFTFPQLCRTNGGTLSEKSMDFIAKCLSIDIDERPSSFQEFLSD
jgi:serine/threonine protein kinase